MPITLYGIHGSPPCRNVLLVAKALNVPVTLQPIDLAKGETRTPEYLKKNPAHSVPTLDDNGHYLWESRAIVTYLINQYGKDDSLYPKDPKKRSQVDNMLYFDACSLYSSIGDYFYPSAFYGKTVDPDRLVTLKDRLAIFDRILSTRPYAAGDHITVADLCLVTTITVPEAFQLSLADYPNVTKWADKVRKELPYYDEATKKGVDEMISYVPKK